MMMMIPTVFVYDCLSLYRVDVESCVVVHWHVDVMTVSILQENEWFERKSMCGRTSRSRKEIKIEAEDC